MVLFDLYTVALYVEEDHPYSDSWRGGRHKGSVVSGGEWKKTETARRLSVKLYLQHQRFNLSHCHPTDQICAGFFLKTLDTTHSHPIHLILRVSKFGVVEIHNMDFICLSRMTKQYVYCQQNIVFIGPPIWSQLRQAVRKSLPTMSVKLSLMEFQLPESERK